MGLGWVGLLDCAGLARARVTRLGFRARSKIKKRRGEKPFESSHCLLGGDEGKVLLLNLRCAAAAASSG